MPPGVILRPPEADEESIFGFSYRRGFRMDSEFTPSPSKGSNAKTLRPPQADQGRLGSE